MLSVGLYFKIHKENTTEKEIATSRVEKQKKKILLGQKMRVRIFKKASLLKIGASTDAYDSPSLPLIYKQKKRSNNTSKKIDAKAFKALTFFASTKKRN